MKLKGRGWPAPRFSSSFDKRAQGRSHRACTRFKQAAFVWHVEPLLWGLKLFNSYIWWRFLDNLSLERKRYQEMFEFLCHRILLTVEEDVLFCIFCEVSIYGDIRDWKNVSLLRRQQKAVSIKKWIVIDFLASPPLAWSRELSSRIWLSKYLVILTVPSILLSNWNRL